MGGREDWIGAFFSKVEVMKVILFELLFHKIKVLMETTWVSVSMQRK